MTRPTEKIPIAALGFTITGGIADIIKIVCPTKAKRMAHWMVR